MAFKKRTFVDSFIELPVGPKVYRIDSPDALTGLQVQQIQALAMAAKNGREISEKEARLLQLDDAEEESFYQRLIGVDTMQEMVDDGIPWEMFKDIANVVMVWITSDQEQAEAFWNQIDDAPKVPNRATRRASAPATRKRASTAGTTSRKKSPVTPGE